MRLVPGFVLLCMSWLQPMHIFPWLSWHSELLAFLSILVVAWGVTYSLNKQPSGVIRVPKIVVPLMALGVVLAFQWIVGLIPFKGEFLAYAGYLVLSVVSISAGYMSVEDRQKSATLFAATLAMGAVCSACIAFVQVFEVWDALASIHRSAFSRRPGANLGQPNQLATLLLMGLVSVMYLYERRKLGSTATVALASVMLLAEAIAESRSGVLGLVVLYVWWFAKRRNLTPRARPFAMALLGLAFLATFVAWPTFLAEVFQTNVGATALNHPSGMNRWIIWPQLIEAVFMRPWLGWGFGQIATAHNAVVHAYTKSEAYTYAHNVGLDFAVGIGLPLMIILTLLVMVWAWRRIRAVGNLDAWFCVAVAIPVVTHSLVEYPYAYAYFLVPVMFAIGMLEGQLGIAEFQVGIKRSVVALLAMTWLTVWSVSEYLAIEEDYRVARFESLRIGRPADGYQRPNVHLFTQLDALLHGTRIKPAPNMPADELALARTVALHFPMIATQNKYALSLALNGETEEAVRQLQVMRAQQGAATYSKIREAWREMAQDQYPQLMEFPIPP